MDLSTCWVKIIIYLVSFQFYLLWSLNLFFSSPFLPLFVIGSKHSFLYFLYNHLFYYFQLNFFSCRFDINSYDQNCFNTIYSQQYSSLPLNVDTYLELGHLRAHNKSQGIHFSIKTSMFSLVKFLLSKKLIFW